MKKIYVTTYCTVSSYGSILQSLGLKRALDSLGYSSTVVQCKQPPGDRYRVRCKRLTPAYIREYFEKLRVYEKLQRKHENTCQFLERYLDIAYFDDINAMKDALKDEQIFLSGSDQVWNPIKMAPEFFLDFAPEGGKKLSYAASMGVLDIPAGKRAEFGRLIGNFDTLSVRETDCAAIVSQFTELQVQVHIDPTFLCNRQQWREIQRPYPVDRPFILVYPLYWDSSLNMQLRQLHDKTGKDIVVIADNRRNIYADQWIFDADPAQFLWLIDHADGVVSSSFHGAALALNYNKPLAAVIDPAAPSRITCLLETLGYPKRDITALGEGGQENFETVNARLQKEIQRSMSYLKEIL